MREASVSVMGILLLGFAQVAVQAAETDAATPSPLFRFASFERDADLSGWSVYQAPPGVSLTRTTNPLGVSDGGGALQVEVHASMPGQVPPQAQILSPPIPNALDYEQVTFDLTALQDLPNLAFGQAPQAAIPPSVFYLPRLTAGQRLTVRQPVTSMIRRDQPGLCWLLFDVPRLARSYSFCIDNIRFTGSRARTRLMALHILASRRLTETSGLTPAQLTVGKTVVQGLGDALKQTHVTAEQAAWWEAEWGTWFSRAFLAAGNGRVPAWGSESAMVRVNRGTRPGLFTGDLRPAVLRLEAARHEYESVQLVLFGGATPMGSVNVRCGTLTNGAQALPADAVQVRLADDVDCSTSPDTSILPTLEQQGARLADPLVPLAPFVLGRNETRAVWLTVNVPAAAVPGTYTAMVNVTVDGQAALSLPLQVRVRNFTLPPQPSFPNLWGFWPYPITNFAGLTRDSADWGGMWRTRNFGEVPPELTARWLRFLGQYKISVGASFTQTLEGQTVTWPARQENGIWDFTDYDRWVGMAIHNGTNAWCAFGNVDTKLTPEKQAELNGYIRALHQHLAEKGWLNHVYIYLADEPSAEKYPTLLAQAKAFRKLAPGLKILLTYNAPIYADPRYATFPGIDAPVLLAKLVYPEYAADCRRLGKEPWWYTCLIPVKPYAGTFVSNPPADLRMIPLQSWKLGYAGYLNWGVNIFGFGNTAPGATRRWPDVPWTFAKYEYPPGDGCLTYPAPDGTPLASVRLENWRDGMEDYEYLTLLKALIQSGKLTGATLAQAQDLVTLTGVVTDLTHYTRQPADLERWRHAVSEILEKPDAR